MPSAKNCSIFFKHNRNHIVESEHHQIERLKLLKMLWRGNDEANDGKKITNPRNSSISMLFIVTDEMHAHIFLTLCLFTFESREIIFLLKRSLETSLKTFEAGEWF